MENKLISKKGITLIALVITIIVLLILAGVSISMISSQDGILNKTVTAKEQSENANGKEEISLAIMASIGEDGTVDVKEFKEKMKGASIEGENLPLIVTFNGRKYTVLEGGNVVENTVPEIQLMLQEGNETVKQGSVVTYNLTIKSENEIVSRDIKAEVLNSANLKIGDAVVQTENNNIKIVIDTSSLVAGTYKIKILEGSVKDNKGLSSKEKISDETFKVEIVSSGSHIGGPGGYN